MLYHFSYYLIIDIIDWNDLKKRVYCFILKNSMLKSNNSICNIYSTFHYIHFENYVIFMKIWKGPGKFAVSIGQLLVTTLHASLGPFKFSRLGPCQKWSCHYPVKPRFSFLHGDEFHDSWIFHCLLKALSLFSEVPSHFIPLYKNQLNIYIKEKKTDPLHVFPGASKMVIHTEKGKTNLKSDDIGLWMRHYNI